MHVVWFLWAVDSVQTKLVVYKSCYLYPKKNYKYESSQEKKKCNWKWELLVKQKQGEDLCDKATINNNNNNKPNVIPQVGFG